MLSATDASGQTNANVSTVAVRVNHAEETMTATVMTKINPHFAVRNAISLFFAFGVLFSFTSLTTFLTLRDVREIIIDYTNCERYNESKTFCENVIKENTNDTCECEILLRVDEEIREPVNLYYGLTNFYQNHRSYVLSKDEKQLSGQLSEEVAIECKPYERNDDVLQRKVIAPCGAIANSLFNDTITLYSVQHASFVPLLRKNLIWPRIKNKFRNPPGHLSTAFENFSRPKAWRKNIWELDPEDSSNNGFENEDLIVWMQPATMPNFRKLYRRIDHNAGDAFANGLPKGDYKLRIDYAYPVIAFNGRKSVIISNTCAFGGKNMFLVYCSFALAAFCISVGLIFALVRYARLGITRL